MSLAAALQRERRLRGHSQEAAAAAIGVDRVTVWRWEALASSPSALEPVAVYLRLSTACSCVDGIVYTTVPTDDGTWKAGVPARCGVCKGTGRLPDVDRLLDLVEADERAAEAAS